MVEKLQSKRLGSLDILRGFDMFCLVFFQPILSSLTRAIDNPFFNSIFVQFRHVEWEGYVFWDIIMPLFMFMAGVSMPFAFKKYLANGSKGKLYKRIIKRVLLLYFFGVIAQGHILDFDMNTIAFYSNVLQTIAVGYLFSAIMMLHLTRTWQIIVTSGLLVVYWVLLSFVQIDGFGGGNFTPDLNLAEYVDRTIFGQFRDGAVLTENGIDYGNYRYTWIVSSLNFVVTVMTGVFAGQILKSNSPERKKLYYLLLTGALMIIAGKLWGLHMPIIKKIWTSPMTLFSSGICFLLMALFYYLVDYKNYGKYLSWLKIWGMNSILAYMLYEVINFRGIAESLFYGLEPMLGNYYQVLITASNVTIIFFILLLMYRSRKFLRV